MLRCGLGARDCGLWREADEGWARVAGAGSGEITVAELPPPWGPASTAPEDVHFTPLSAAGGTVGVLGLARDEPLAEPELKAVGTVANLLVCALTASDQARRLADQVASNTREIEAQHRFIERIIDSLPVGLYVVDREYRVHAWNRKRETGMQGILREEAMGRTIFEILRRQPADLLRREFDEVFKSGDVMQLEMESTATGERRIYRVSKVPMRINDTDVTHVITIGEDITDAKRAQTRIAQAEKLAALGQLAAGVMHEINNPLATIGACAETMVFQLQDGEVPAPLREAFDEYCHIIDHEVHRCKRIVDGLLDFSRPKSDDRGPVDMNEVVAHTLFLLKHHARFKRMTVETSVEATVDHIVRGNREQLVQVVMALLLNATDAMSDGGAIHIRTFARPVREVVTEVRDEGHGIPASELTRIFEPFYTTKSPGRGTGLGLSICYSIVADHGGRIEVESTVGEGSIFRICLPVEGAGGEA
jgi:two-component system NtrC family sensor kinase